MTIDIGIIGLGWVATHRHIPSILQDRRFRIVGVADRDGVTAQKWGKRLGVAHCAASSLADIEWLHKADAIDIATAPMSHYALAAEALSAGKHVITEKPFVMSLQEGEDLVARAGAARRALAIVHNFQFANAVVKLRGDIERGVIGPIRAISATQWGNPSRRLPKWYDTLPGGLFYDESPHLLYLVRTLSPGPISLVGVDACPSSMGLRTPASIDASFRAHAEYGTVPVSISCRFESPLSEWHVAVLGERSAGIIDVFRNIYLRLPNDGGHGTREVLTTSLKATWSHWWQHLTNGPQHLAGRLLYGNPTIFERFANSIASGTPPAGISGDDALSVLRLQWDILSRCREVWDN
ncbi:Gfo/Idh/MocA family oxidoreductase [Luteimonas composti]|uniref:Gfo/Idh/MocA family oxidoreductase n=1 Tax=Luteimonas composti TaxID=398257 RepID=A0ABT6MP58_9GAMM|nr:Gfo/Idh/MocA family oxidoreductase [Luteimonas composti]MDH7452391.1 Gfo/Idh/MocA family oxidoreductase [Luteimonas composti]